MLKKIPKNIPTGPGVYMFIGPRGSRLYIGKAKNLQARIRSYFNMSRVDERLTALRTESSRLMWQHTASEIEALIREAQLIKRHRPKFNVALKDTDRYSYVIVAGSPLPHLFVSHQPNHVKQSAFVSGVSDIIKSIGPFTDATALRTTLKILRKSFPNCTCTQRHDRPCLNFHLGKCPGYCCLKADKGIDAKRIKEYQKNIDAIVAILSGKKKVAFKQLEHDMKRAAIEGDFERAITLRTRLEKAERLYEHTRVLSDIADREEALTGLKQILSLTARPDRIECYDISNIQGLFATGSMVVFVHGVPQTSSYRKFRIRTSRGPDDTAMLREVLLRRMRHPEWPFPDLMLIDGGKGQLNAAVRALHDADSLIPIMSIAKGKQELFATTLETPIPLSELPESVRNMIVHLDEEAHRFAITYYRRLHRKNR